MQPFVAVQEDDEVSGRVEITRAAKNHRLMDLKLSFQVLSKHGLAAPKKTANYFIE